MSTKLFYTLTIILFANIAFAQHCKFDGFTVLVVKIENEKGKPLALGKYSLTLKKHTESLDSSETCSSTFYKRFDTVANILLHTEDSIWNSYAQKYASLKLFTLKNCYAIVLSDVELACLLNTENKIHLVARYKKNERTLSFYPTKKNVYPLCSSYGEWATIKPYLIKLFDKK